MAHAASPEAVKAAIRLGGTASSTATAWTRSVSNHWLMRSGLDALIFLNSLASTDLHWAEKDSPEAVAETKIKDFRLHTIGMVGSS